MRSLALTSSTSSFRYARRIEPLPDATISVIPKTLVLGGGLSGVTSALSLARQGFECYLVERQAKLGGNLRQTYFTLEGPDPQAYLKELVEQVNANERIHVFTETTVEALKGFVGNFRTHLSNGTGDSQEIEHGTIIVATGATAYEPDGYLYGQNDHVMLQQTLEEKLAQGKLDAKGPKHVVMIQCVGSRNKTRPYCSAVCCNQAIKNALKIKELSPDTNVTILYRDVMSYGFSEDYYSLARERGIMFIRYEAEHMPQVAAVDGKVKVTVHDPLMGQDVVMDADLLALSTAMVPYENQALIEKLKVPLSSDGFFLESHAQLKPVDSYVDGIYLCGKAQFPKPADECIAQAKAAAAKAAILMAKGYVTAEPIAAVCDADTCIGCGICAHLCPYSAIRMTKVGKLKKAEVVAAACKGCGVCASYCPTRAMATGRFTDEQIEEQIAAFGAGG